MDFTCGAAVGPMGESTPESAFFPCRHSLNCTFDSIKGEVCEACPEGWEHDLYGFAHFYNCAIPSSVPLIFCVFQGVLLGLGLMLVVYLFKTEHAIKGKTRLVLSMNLICATAAWLSVLSLYLQRGLFEGSLISLMCLGNVGFLIAPTMVPVLLRPIASATNNLVMLRMVTRLSWLWAGGGNALYTSLLIAALVTCRDENPRVFNAITLATVWLTVVVLGCQGIAIIHVSRRLARVLHILSNKSDEGGSPGSYARLSEQAEKRHRFILGQLKVISVFVGILLFGAIVLIVPLVLWSIYGSLPFLWVFHSGAFSVVTLTFPLVAPFVRGSSTAPMSSPNLVSSSAQGHIISESCDVVDVSPFRGLGIKKVRKNPPWKIRVGKLLSKISEIEEQSRVESSVASKFMMDRHASSGVTG